MSVLRGSRSDHRSTCTVPSGEVPRQQPQHVASPPEPCMRQTTCMAQLSRPRMQEIVCTETSNKQLTTKEPTKMLSQCLRMDKVEVLPRDVQQRKLNHNLCTLLLLSVKNGLYQRAPPRNMDGLHSASISASQSGHIPPRASPAPHTAQRPQSSSESPEKE